MFQTYSSFMLAQRSMNDTHVEENLAGVANLVEFTESIVEFIVVVAGEGRDPSLDFLCSWSLAPTLFTMNDTTARGIKMIAEATPWGKKKTWK